jgi:hypothetical protein
MFNFFKKYREELEMVENVIGNIIPGKDFAELNVITNSLGNLAQVNISLSSEALPEARRRKKRRTNELSGVGAIAGYVGKLSGPSDPGQFYSKMASATGGEYLVDPVKNSKQKP